MAVNRTTLLDLPLPVTGTESGTWGDTTNNGLTQYLDIAIAGTLVLSTDADVTLTSTEGDSSATNIGATTAQYAILRWTATGSTTRNITALAQSKTYVVINATGGTQSIVLRGAGPTTGVTIISGEKAHCVWNGSDFVKVSSSAAAGGSNTQVQYNSSGVLAGSSNMTFDGTSLTLGGNPTLSAGTANGVLYLNGSKVATSGSALTFDGNTLGVATTAGNMALLNSTNANGGYLTFQRSGVSKGYIGSAAQLSGGSSDDFTIRAEANLIFSLVASEGMRLTSTGLGIGTSSPQAKVDARITSDGNVGYFRRVSGTINPGITVFANETGNTVGFDTVYSTSSPAYKFRTGGSDIMTLDSSGNLGLGVTPSAWSTTFKAFQVGNQALWSLAGGNGYLSNNTTFNTSNTYVYRYDGFATEYIQSIVNGSHSWYTAPSGTAGNAITFTQAMTLDASGNLLVGATSLAFSEKFQMYGNYAVFNNASYTGFIGQGSALGTATASDFAIRSSNALAFLAGGTTERARITSGGKFLIGTTSTIGTLTVDAVDAITTGNSSTYAITCGNDVADALAFGSDASYAYIQSFNSKKLVINLEGNEVLVAGTTDNGAYNLQCNGTGVWGAGAYVNGSDERLKDNIQTLNDGLAVVSQLRPVTFQYKPEHSKDQSVQPGFIAQELQQAMDGKAYLDGVVQSGPEYLNVAYQNLIPILTKAIQEQQALITSLTARVARLEGN